MVLLETFQPAVGSCQIVVVQLQGQHHGLFLNQTSCDGDTLVAGFAKPVPNEFVESRIGCASGL